jgi:hypothetical protein
VTSQDRAWHNPPGSTTVVLVTKGELFIHGNLGWMGPVTVEEGSTPLETGEALATAWGLQEVDAGYYLDDAEGEREEEEAGDEGDDWDGDTGDDLDAEAAMWAGSEPDCDPDEDRTP